MFVMNEPKNLIFYYNQWSKHINLLSMIKVIRIDEIHKCFECDGKGYVVTTDINLLERVRKKCEQCDGNGLVKYSGAIELHPYKSYNEKEGA